MWFIAFSVILVVQEKMKDIMSCTDVFAKYNFLQTIWQNPISVLNDRRSLKMLVFVGIEC